MVSVLKKQQTTRQRAWQKGSTQLLSLKPSPCLLGIKPDFYYSLDNLSFTSWDLGLSHSIALLILGRKAFIMTKEEPALSKAYRQGQSSHLFAICSENNDVWIAWAEVTGAYKNQAVTARKLMCVTTESTKGKNFETF